MYKVDVIRPGSLNNIIGPVGTLKRIIKNRNYFIDRGYDFKIFTHDVFNENLDSGEKVNSVVNANSLLVKLKASLRRYAKKSIILSFIYLAKNYFFVKKLVKYYISLRRNPDIIVFHSDLECYLYLKLSKCNSSKLIMFLHSDGIPLKMESIYYPIIVKTWIYRKMMNIQDYASSHVDKLVFIANIGRINFLKYFPNVEFNKTAIILNGIEDLSLEESENVDVIRSTSQKSKFKYRLCCTGTINTRKGHDIIVEALHLVNKDVLKDIHVSFLGEGPQRVKLEKKLKEYNLGDNVSFLGKIPNSQVYRYIAESNIYILMSLNEGLPISIIEAMRAGLPIIATNISGIPELVENNYNGILLEPSVNDLANLFNSMGNYDWGQMGKVSRKRFENEFTFRRMEEEYCDMLDSVFNKK